MSFTKDVKEELTKKMDSNSTFNKVLLESMIRLSSVINENEIIFKSSNIHVVNYYKQLLNDLYSLVPTENYIKDTLNNANIYTLKINDISLLNNDMSLSSNTSQNKEKVLIDDELTKIYLRGAFLVKGTVSDPNSSNYHLELVISNEQEAIFLQRLMNKYDLNAKITKRKKNLIIYIKEIQMIKDFLRIIGTVKNVFLLEEVVINKGFEVEIKRIMNMEIANERKSIKAADEQLENIHYLKLYYPIEKLDEKILMVMQARINNPNANFNELKDYINKVYGEDITKSAINHRFRKIKEIVQFHKDNRGEE